MGTADAPGLLHARSLLLYRAARSWLAQQHASATSLHSGYWVFQSGHSAPLGFVAAIPGQHSVLGRHSECNLAVDDEHTSFALRQALLRARREAGVTSLSVMDLESTTGILLADHRSVRALHATGPFTALMGGVLLLFVPEAPGLTLPDTLPAPEILRADARDAAPGDGEGDGGAAERPSRRGYGVAQPRVGERRLGARRGLPGDEGITSRVEERAGYERIREGSLIPREARDGSLVAVDLRAAREAGATTLAVATGDGPVGTLVLSPAELERGVLLGRYDRCWDLGGARLSGNVSRVHALLIHERGALHILDLASMNGVFVDDQEVRASALERHQRIRLSDDLLLEVIFVGAPSPPSEH